MAYPVCSVFYDFKVTVMDAGTAANPCLQIHNNHDNICLQVRTSVHLQFQSYHFLQQGPPTSCSIVCLC